GLGVDSAPTAKPPAVVVGEASPSLPGASQGSSIAAKAVFGEPAAATSVPTTTSAPATTAPAAEGAPAAEAGPRGPRRALGHDVTESFHDPDPTTYRNGLRPDTPVTDHVTARALGGDPVDPRNLHTKAWSENARKGWHEGEYLRLKNAYMKEGLTEAQAEWVLEEYKRFIETDVHPTPVDPRKLDKLKSP